MTNHGKTRSTVKPEAIVIDEFSVWTNTNIQPVSEKDGEQEFNGFEYDVVQYEKDEYIRLMAQRNAEIGEVINTLLGVNDDE